MQAFRDELTDVSNKRKRSSSVPVKQRIRSRNVVVGTYHIIVRMHLISYLYIVYVNRLVVEGRGSDRR